LILLRFPSREDDVTRKVQQYVDQDIILDQNIFKAQRQISALELDIIVYTEIGMDSRSYFLSLSKLALRSAVFWGHAITSGHDTIDYFISSKDFEQESSDIKYSECLYRMNGLTTIFQQPDVPQNNFDRAHFGLHENGVMYLVPQTLYKIHPDFDQILLAILKAVPASYVVFPIGAVKEFAEKLLSRWKTVFPKGYLSRMHFVRNMNSEEFLTLCALADGNAIYLPSDSCMTL